MNTASTWANRKRKNFCSSRWKSTFSAKARNCRRIIRRRKRTNASTVHPDADRVAMPTIFTHAVAGASLAQMLAPDSHRRAVTALAAVTAMLPDADVIGFRLGIPYGDL